MSDSEEKLGAGLARPVARRRRAARCWNCLTSTPARSTTRWLSTVPGLCVRAAEKKCTRVSALACPRSPREGPARAAKPILNPPRARIRLHRCHRRRGLGRQAHRDRRAGARRRTPHAERDRRHSTQPEGGGACGPPIHSSTASQASSHSRPAPASRSRLSCRIIEILNQMMLIFSIQIQPNQP